MPLEAKSAKPQGAESKPSARTGQGGLPSPFAATGLSAVADNNFVKVLPQEIAMLQRAIGNRQVAALLGRNRRAQESNERSGGLRVGPAADRYEAEADRISRQVVTGGNPLKANPSPTVAKVQKSPEPQIRRLVDVETFRQNTNKGALRQRGDILNGVDTLIKQYNAYPPLVRDDGDRQRRLALLDRLLFVTGKWVERHDVTQMTTVSNSTKKNKRSDKLGTIVAYLKTTFTQAVDAEKVTVTQARTHEELNDRRERRGEQRRTYLTGKRLAKLQNVTKYRRRSAKEQTGLDTKFRDVKTNTGKFFGSILPTILRLLAPGPGDLGKFDFQLEFPLDASGVPWYVGGRVYLEAEAKESNEFKTKFKAAFRTGPKIGGVKMALETGVQLESQAQSAEEVSNLLNFGMYRRFRESNVIPRGITNSLWGGAKGTMGYLNSENWAKDVKQIFTKGKNSDKAYVDLGFYGSAQAEGSVGVAKLGGNIDKYKGRKYTKHTLDVRKGGVDNTEYSKKGAQKSAGQGSSRWELGVKAGVKPWAGDVKLKYEAVKALPTQQNLQKGTAGSYRPHKYELEINAQVAIPLGGGLAQHIMTSAGPGIAKMIRDTAVLVQARQAKKETGKMGTSMFIGQLGELAGGFENNIEYNQIAGEGLGSGLGVVNSAGERGASEGAKAFSTESGFRFRFKLAKEYALDRSKPSSIKAEGSLYAINVLGGEFYGNKVKLDRATRIGQLKWEKDKKIRFELFGIAGMAEKKVKANSPQGTKPTWHKPTYQKYEAPVV